VKAPGLLKVTHDVRFAHASTFRPGPRGPDRR